MTIRPTLHKLAYVAQRIIQQTTVTHITNVKPIRIITEHSERCYVTAVSQLLSALRCAAEIAREGECPTLAAPPPVTRRGFHTHDGLKDANPPKPEYTALMYTMSTRTAVVYRRRPPLPRTIRSILLTISSILQQHQDDRHSGTVQNASSTPLFAIVVSGISPNLRSGIRLGNCQATAAIMFLCTVCVFLCITVFIPCTVVIV